MYDRGLRCGPLIQLVGAPGCQVEKVPFAPHLAGTTPEAEADGSQTMWLKVQVLQRCFF